MIYSDTLKDYIEKSESFDFKYMSRLFMIDFIDVNGATIISDNLNSLSLNKSMDRNIDMIYSEEQNYNEIFFSAAHINEKEPEKITLNEMISITILLIEIYKKRIQKNFPDRQVEIIAIIEEEFGLSVNMRVHTIHNETQITQVNTSDKSNDQFKSYTIIELIEPNSI